MFGLEYVRTIPIYTFFPSQSVAESRSRGFARRVLRAYGPVQIAYLPMQIAGWLLDPCQSLRAPNIMKSSHHLAIEKSPGAC